MYIAALRSIMPISQSRLRLWECVMSQVNLRVLADYTGHTLPPGEFLVTKVLSPPHFLELWPTPSEQG